MNVLIVDDLSPGLIPLLNRASDGTFKLPDDGWYHIARKGEFLNPEAGVTQVVDSIAIEKMVNRFQQDKAKPNFAGLLVDYDHFSYDNEKSSDAAGWIMDLKNRAEGLFGQIKWTPTGEAAVKNGNFRFISPVWLPNQLEKVGDKRYRPLRLDTAGLTNAPNIRGMAPLSNRAGSGDLADKQTTTPTNTMKTIAAKLGLSAEASEDAILVEVTKLVNRATEAETALAPLKNRITTLEADNKGLLDGQVEADLEKYSNRFKPATREKLKAQLLANRAATIDLLESLEEINPAGDTTGKAPLTNRAKATPPGTKGAPAKNEEQVRVTALTNRARALQTGGRSFDDAWNMAVQEEAAAATK